jgi:hypothetical protein
VGGGKTVEDSSVFLVIFPVLSFDLFLLRRWYALFEPADLSFPIRVELQFRIGMRLKHSIGGKYGGGLNVSENVQIPTVEKVSKHVTCRRTSVELRFWPSSFSL